MGYRFLPADYRIRKGTCWGRSREYNHSKAVSLCLERLLAWVSASSYLISWSPTSSPGGSPRASYIIQRRCLWVKESKGMNHSAPWAWDFETNELSAEPLQGSSLACSQGQRKAEPWFQESEQGSEYSTVRLGCVVLRQEHVVVLRNRVSHYDRVLKDPPGCCTGKLFSKSHFLWEIVDLIKP